MILFSVCLVFLLSKSAVSISTGNTNQETSDVLLRLSNPTIQENYHKYYSYRPNNQYASSPYQDSQNSVMDKLFSLAQNDDLQCVPKLLCEMTAGGVVGIHNLPDNINFESLATFLSRVNSINMSPVFHFGKAALLGVVSKGNTMSCKYAYPECPSDPDKLIKYLNNHNGGFFKFFQGVNPFQSQYFNSFNPDYFGQGKIAEKRIQNKPIEFAYAPGKKYSNFIKLSQSSQLKFPDQKPYSRENTLRFHDFMTTHDIEELDIQQPLPNHVPSPHIFPDRTGTGELKLDYKEIEKPLTYDTFYYNQLLYDSFPNIGKSRKNRLSFPEN